MLMQFMAQKRTKALRNQSNQKTGVSGVWHHITWRIDLNVLEKGAASNFTRAQHNPLEWSYLPTKL